MTERPKKPALDSLPDLTPLTLEREGTCLVFTLRPQEDILIQLPHDYEARLAENLANILSDPGDLSIVVDLQGIPAVSSRQLGSLIALGKVLRPRFGQVPLKNVSTSVRHLLEMTRIDHLFALESAHGE